MQGMGLRRIGHTVELVDTPETRGMILKVRHLVTVGMVIGDDGSSCDSEFRITIEDSIWISNLRPPKGAKHPKKRDRPRPGLGQRQDRRAAGTRARSRARASSTSAASKAARCRCTAACRSAGFHNLFRVEYEVVNLDTLARAVRRRHRGHAGAAARARPRRPQPASVKVLARGDIAQGADGARAQVQRQGGGEDRRRRRQGRGADVRSVRTVGASGTYAG